MSLPVKILIVVASLILMAFGFVLVRDSGGGYHRSDKEISTVELMKNAYKFQGQSGVLDARFFTFDHMAGDNLAIYKTSLFEFAINDQLAVRVADNLPPEHLNYWRVYVNGPDDFKNGLGADIRIPEVTFEGEYVPSAPAVTTSSISQPPPQVASPSQSDKTSTPVNTVENEVTSQASSADVQQLPAPIERRDPSTPQSDNAVFSCQVPKHHIVIDRVADGKVRYRSWNVPKQLTDAPDVDLMGTDNIEGTGPCSHPVYAFTSGNVRYQVEGTLGCSDASEPKGAKGDLIVEISGKQVTQNWCY